MDSDLLDLIYTDITNRKTWADRQAVWYQMRRDGLRRRNKPYPGAADLHFPLIDTIIEKLKPFYLNQLFATERLADFTSKDPQKADGVMSAAWWFDYKLKQKSNLEKQIALCIDYMLQNGRGILKVYWDTKSKRVCFDAIEPIYLIVPSDTTDLATADRIVHVKHLSPWKYKHGEGSEHYNKAADFVKRITGPTPDREDQQLQESRRLREGLTHTTDKNTIIIWEIYERTVEGWKVHTISPSAPAEDVRPAFVLPYKSTQTPKCPPPPFLDFTMEECEKGYYSPRGVSEIEAPFETYICKTWNEKADAMTFYNRPIYYSERDMPNAGNIKMMPGQILPFPIQRVEQGAPPVSFDVEIQNTRMIAEQRIAVPDFGTGDQQGTKDNKTATEVEAIMATGSQITDMRSRIFRRQLGELYQQAWDRLCQYDTDFEFLRDGKMDQFDKALRDEVISIAPNGSSDSWNLQRRKAKAVQRMTLFVKNPFVNQGELTKSVLELDEPGLVQKLFMEPGTKQTTQAERQMIEIPALEDGLFLNPKPDDDDAIHVQILLQYMARSAQEQKPLSQVGAQTMQQHLQAHMGRLQQSDPKAARAIGMQVKQMFAGAAGGQQPERAAA